MDATQLPLIASELQKHAEIVKESPEWVPPFNDIIDNVNLSIITGNIEIADPESYGVLTKSYNDLEISLNEINKKIAGLKSNIDYKNFNSIVHCQMYNLIMTEYISGKKPKNVINEDRLLELWKNINNNYNRTINHNPQINTYRNQILENNNIIARLKQDIERVSKMRNKTPNFNVKIINDWEVCNVQLQNNINSIISTIEKPDVLIMYSTDELYETAAETYLSITKQLSRLKKDIKKLQSSMKEYKDEITLELWRGRYQNYAKKYQLNVDSENLFRVCNMHKLNDVLYKTRFLCRCEGPDEHNCYESNCSLCENVEYNYFQSLEEKQHTFKFTKNNYNDNLTTCTGMIGRYRHDANVEFISFTKEIVNRIGFIHNPKLTIDDILVTYLD